MAGNAPGSLYGFAQEGDTYHHADIILCTSPLPANHQFLLADLGEASFPGYVRPTATTLEELYPEKDLIPGRVCRLTSRRLLYRNNGAIGVNFTGLALVIWSTVSNPIVIAVTVSPGRIAAGGIIAGRHIVTSNINDFVP